VKHLVEGVQRTSGYLRKAWFSFVSIAWVRSSDEAHGLLYQGRDLWLPDLVKALDGFRCKDTSTVPKKLLEPAVADFRLTKVCCEQQAGCPWSRTEGLSKDLWPVIDVYGIPNRFDNVPVPHAVGVYLSRSRPQQLLTGDYTSVRSVFAFFGVIERNGGFPTVNLL
jgi:hypothetical protein